MLASPNISNVTPLIVWLSSKPAIVEFDDEKLEFNRGDLYSGGALWNLNPSQIVVGHFQLPIPKEVDPFLYRVEVFWSIVDILDREHQMLPFSYVWSDPGGDWWFDPRVKHGVSPKKGEQEIES